MSLQRRSGDIAGALATGRRLAALMDEKRITDLPKNHKTLYFPAEGGTVFLRGLEEKRCYAHRSVSATAYLVGQPDTARDDAAQAKSAACPGEWKVSRLIASDLRRLKETQPTLRDRIDQYLAEHLNGRRSTRQPEATE